MKTKLICLSDTHNKTIDLKKFPKQQGYEYIFIHCGDFIQIDASLKENEKRINSVKQFDYVVQGNHFYLEKNRLKGGVHFKEISEETYGFAGQLPLFKILNISGVRILIAHSIVQCLYRDMTMNELCKWNPESQLSCEMEIMQEIVCQKKDIDIYIYGHTHTQYIHKIDDITFINCGYGEKNEFCEITIEKSAHSDVSIETKMKKLEFKTITNEYKIIKKMTKELFRKKGLKLTSIDFTKYGVDIYVDIEIAKQSKSNKRCSIKSILHELKMKCFKMDIPIVIMSVDYSDE